MKIDEFVGLSRRWPVLDVLRAGPLDRRDLQERVISIAPEPVPIILTIADEQVIIGAVDDDGSPRGLIVTDDELIRAWAEETVDGYLARAEQLTPGAIDTRAVATDGGE